MESIPACMMTLKVLARVSVSGSGFTILAPKVARNRTDGNSPFFDRMALGSRASN